MPDRRLLYLTQHQMLAYRWQGGHCIPEGSFAAESAVTDFADYLKAHAKSLFTVVTNIAEEGFQQETIPYVQSRDRAAIVKRKIDQAFMGAPLSVAIPLGHEKTRRRNERLLLAALTSGSQLEPWLLALRAAETRLAGIVSLPLLTDALAASLKLPKERCIVVTVQDGTVRQSFLDAGKLVFSRVAPLASSSIGGMAKSILGEIARLQQYLQTQRLIGRAETITAHVLLHPNALSALDPNQAPTNVEISLVDLHQAARKVGLRDLPEDSRAQALFLQLAEAHPPAQQFATPALRKHYRIWQIGNALQAIGIVCFLTTALYAGKLHFDKDRLAERTVQMAATAADNERRYQAVLATFPPMPMDNDALRLVVDRLQSVQNSDRTPDALLRDLSRALDRTPQVELTQLEWIGRPAPEGSSSPAAGAQASGAEDEALAVKGTVFAGRSGSPRQLIDLFDQFVEQLRTTPGITVNVLKQPFDVTSGRALKSGESAATAELPREFELRIQRKNPS
jgi:hypothetical protein